MPYSEQQIEQIFQQLGITTQRGGAYQGRGAYEGAYTGAGAYTPSSKSDQVPLQYRQHLETDPAALDQVSGWQQFWWGVTSPVTGTLHKLDPDRFSQFETKQPHNTGGMLARMAGSIVGWGALFGGASLAVIGAPLTVAASGVAAGVTLLGKAVGIGVGAKLATAVGTGVVTGGIASAHHAWLDDRPIAPEVLKGMAFGAAFGAGGQALGKVLTRAKIKQPDSYQMMKDAWLKRHPGVLMNDPTPETMRLTMSAAQARHGAFESVIMRAAKPAKVTPLADDIVAGFTKGQKANYQTMLKAKTFGEQIDAYAKVEKAVKDGFSAFKKSNNAKNLQELVDKGATHKTAMEYVRRWEAVDTLKMARNHHFREITKGAVELPTPHQIGFDLGEDKFWAGVQQDVKSYGVDKGNLYWNEKINQVFIKHSERTGQNYSRLNRKFWPDELKLEFDKVSGELQKAGESAKFYIWGETAFPVPEGIPKAGLAKWIGEQTKLPKEPGWTPVSLAEAWSAKSDVNWLTRNFFPVRYAVGKSSADQLRVAVRQHQTWYNNNAAVPISKWSDMLGVKGKELSRQGTIIGQRGLELDWTPEFNAKYENAANSLIAIAGKKIKGVDVGHKFVTKDRQWIAQTSKELGVPKSALWKAYNHYESRINQTFDIGKGKSLKFEEYLSHINSSPREYVAQWLKQYKLLYSGAKPTTEVAKQMGFENVKQLKVSYQMKRAFNKIFEEADIDPMMYQVAYMPRFKTLDGLGPNHFPQAFKTVGADKKLSDTLMWMNQMHREMPQGVYTYETDAFKAFSRYMSGYSKKKAYEPVFKNINQYMKDAKFSKSRMETYQKLQEHLKGVPTQIEQEMDRMIHNFGNALNWKGWNNTWGPKPTKEMMSVLAELQVMGGLGFNPFTAAKNLTQKILAFSSITDDGNPLHGMAWMMKAQAKKRTAEGKRMLSWNKIAEHRQFHESFSVVDDSMSAVLRKMGLPDPAVGAGKAFKKASMKMFKATDMSNVEDTFLAKLLYMQSKGHNVTHAINAAHQTTMATQFMYGFDSPMFYKSTGPLGPVGRAVGVFTSWPLNWAHLMYTQGTAGEANRAIASVVSMAIASEVLGLTKFSFNSIHPAETAKGILPLAALEGEQKLPMLLRSAATAAGAYQAFRDGDFATVDQALTNFRQRMWLLVPAGTMMKRTIEIIDIAQAEWRKTGPTGQRVHTNYMDMFKGGTEFDVTDDRGRLRHTATAGEVARSFFGPTIEQNQRYQDWKRVSELDFAYKHMRRRAMDAFMEGDLEDFQYLQEQLVINFGKWIEPKDIKWEMELRGMSARERQLQGLPKSIKDPFLEMMEERRTERLGYILER